MAARMGERKGNALLLHAENVVDRLALLREIEEAGAMAAALRARHLGTGALRLGV